MYKYILDGVRDGVYFVDKERNISFWNHAAERITGFSSKEVIGKPCHNNVLNHIDNSGCELCKTECPLHKTLKDGKIRDQVVYLHHKEGHRVPVQVHIVPIIESGEIVGAVETFASNDEKINFYSSLEELKIIAYQDQLTGLPNRRKLEVHLNEKQEDLKENKTPFSVALFDIDNFKAINDIYGHDIGDEMLKMAGRVFKALERKGDLIGRWGGEEFLGVFPTSDVTSLETILDRIRVVFEKSNIQRNEIALNATISIGASQVVHGESIQETLKRADEALYFCKANGKNLVKIG